MVGKDPSARVFSRLASMKRRKTSVDHVQEDDDDDDNILIENEIVYLDETARQCSGRYYEPSGIDSSYDGHDICEHARRDTLTFDFLHFINGSTIVFLRKTSGR